MSPPLSAQDGAIYAGQAHRASESLSPVRRKGNGYPTDGSNISLIDRRLSLGVFVVLPVLYAEAAKSDRYARPPLE